MPMWRMKVISDDEWLVGMAIHPRQCLSSSDTFYEGIQRANSMENSKVVQCCFVWFVCLSAGKFLTAVFFQGAKTSLFLFSAVACFLVRAFSVFACSSASV